MPPLASEPRIELAEHDRGLGGVDALAEDGLGERVGAGDGEAGEAEAGVDRDGGHDDAGQDVFDGGAGLEGFMSHDDRPAHHDEEHQEGVGDAFGHPPQLADPALGGDIRGGEQGVAEEGKDRVECGGDQVSEPAVDGGLDVPGDVEESWRGLIAATHGAAAARRRRGGRGAVSRADLDSRRPLTRRPRARRSRGSRGRGARERGGR